MKMLSQQKQTQESPPPPVPELTAKASTTAAVPLWIDPRPDGCDINFKAIHARQTRSGARAGIHRERSEGKHRGATIYKKEYVAHGGSLRCRTEDARYPTEDCFMGEYDTPDCR